MNVTRYAKSGELSIAYQVVGDGPLDLVVVPGIVSHVEAFHELPGYSRFIEQLARFARVITFDKRGTGLSDRVADAPLYEQRMDDILAVMDAAGSERAALFGISEGGPLSAMFAASHPDRALALVTFGAFARVLSAPDYSGGIDLETATRLFAGLLEIYGTGASLAHYSPSRGDDKEAQALWAKVERLSASPGGFKSLAQHLAEIDVRCVLPAVKVPTLVLHPEHDVFPVETSKYLAQHIPGARWLELKGVDHYPWFGSVGSLVAEIEEFLTGVRHEPEVDRILATLLFTDIVDSTTRAAELGDRRWRELLEKHHALVRRQLERHRGREVDTAGDGFLATFDGPARAVRCAAAIREAVGSIGLVIRAGLHTGECELFGARVAGIAVHLGARILALAGPGDVLVSTTVKDLVAGSGLCFADRGVHTLKGVPGQWHLFAAEL
jgi:class 3 adenylate cyclase/alpha-beta hydrolase superfamily lysophospholipase